MNFYAVIIGTEILNGRREDKHFAFLKAELAKYGHELFSSFVIKDDEKLINDVYNFIKNDPKSVMFSFGGIGSTPDDLTREIAAKVFTGEKPQRDEKFFQDVLECFGEEAYPHRIHMSEIPVGSELLFNPINNMSGFALEERFFFVPGFPQMAHPMLSSAIEQYFSTSKEKLRLTLLADTSENTLISLMQQLPHSIELSSLPMFKNTKPMVELSLVSEDKEEVEKYFLLFQKELSSKNIKFTII